MKTPLPERIFLIAVMAFLAAGAAGYAGYRHFKLDELRVLMESQNAGLEQTLKLAKENLLRTQEELVSAEEGKTALAESLASEEGKNKVFESQIREISATVNTLQKLSETDPELLKKYSKIYFLSENYSPAQLSAVDPKYLYNKNKSQLFLSGALPYLVAMLESARRDGVTLEVMSAYRSFYEQASVKYGYKVTYGGGANQFSADQGYSEHQLGTAVDFTTPEVGDAFSKFEGSGAYGWLKLNAHKFGFALSYPKDNAYYQFEPWHWRFVGIALTTKLHGSGEYFYNLSQREIDGYLALFFN